MFLAAQFLGILGSIFSMMSIQFKHKKNILIFMILASIFFITSFILLNAYTGAVILTFGVIQILVTYILDSKFKKTPIYLVLIYILISIVLGIISFKTYIDTLPIISSILFTFIIIQKKEKNIRKITIVNVFIWIIYSMYVAAYTPMLFNMLNIISITIAIIRYDIIKKDVTMLYLNGQTN